MRVVGGEFKKMKLSMVDSKLTRPTTDKVKESIFSIIYPYINDGNVLDLFAGSGSLGIEAVSRGYKKAYLIDQSKLAIETIKKNVEATTKNDRFVIIKKTAQAVVEQLKGQVEFNLVLLDPPYAKQQIIQNLKELLNANLLSEDAIIVAETDEHGFNSINQNYDKNFFELITTKKYGITFLTILRRIK
jgi:16S rRNA (guanine966-N2)-methyltransferase